MRLFLLQLKWLIPFVIFALITWFLWGGFKSNPHIVSSALINKPVPSFRLPNLFSPSEFLSNTIFKGHISLLNVFASWCVACRAEHSVLLDIQRSKQVLLVGLDFKDNKTAVKRWLRRDGNPYQIVLFDQQGQAAINFGVYGTPETFLIDRRGIIRDKYIGPISPRVWKNKLLPEIRVLQRSQA